MPRRSKPPIKDAGGNRVRCSSGTSRRKSRAAAEQPSLPRQPLLAACQDRLFDIAQLVLAKKDLVADKEGRRSDSAARDRALGIRTHLFLHRGGLVESPA